MTKQRHSFGFTLVELLVTVAIVTLLVSLLLPTARTAKESARRVKCLANQRQTGIAIRCYAEANRGVVPTWTRISIGTMTTDAFNWNDAVLVKPLTPYMQTTDTMNCPSVPVANPVKYTFPTIPGLFTIPAYWFSRQLFLAGMADPQVYNSGAWYDNPRSAPRLNILADPDPSRKVIVADMNVFVSITGNFGWSNHTGAEYISGLVSFQTSIVGGNRLYLDGHGAWVTRDFMGKNGTPITSSITSARFNALGRYGDARLYYW